MNTPAHPAASAAKARFTTAEFVRMVEAGAFADMKVELVHGELERMNPPMNVHGARQAQTTIRLARVVSESLLLGEVGITLNDDTVLACDVAVLRAPVTDNRLLRPGDVLLVIEIAETTAARDMGMKRLAYAAAGIAHYWVIDGPRSVVHVYGEPVAGDYAAARAVPFGGALAVPGSAATIVLD